MRLTHNLPVSLPQPPTPSAEVLALRTNWKWAYLSHFLFTYNPMLHLEDIQLSELEDDLANGSFLVLPTVMQRLLTSLTPHDKRSILQNWQHHLRKQSLRRAPLDNLMGTEDDPVEFSTLIMTDKLHVLQSLCEWQFNNPNNLRTRMRDDDDYANWRIEPIAYDAKGNAFWLMGGNRLWIQHAPPRKGAARSHKRKQPATSTTNGRKSNKRGRPAVVVPPKPVPSKSKATTNSTSSGRPTRSTRNLRTPAESSGQKPTRTLGTRASTRLRGKEEDDVWQAIPEEWLQEGSIEDATGRQPNGKQKGKKEDLKETFLNPLDDISELTSLSDLSDIQEEHEVSSDDEEGEEEAQELPLSPSPDLSSVSEDNWETVCVTLAEWEAFPQRFENSTHRGEKAFYKLLMNELVPMITEVLRVDVRKKHMEEAVVHRKRSSRIAVKESVKEAERAEARRKAEEEKEMERHRRWEARARKEEEDRQRREASRSARLREKARSESMDVDVLGGESEVKPQMSNETPPGIYPAPATPTRFVVNGSKTGTQTPKDDEPWELDCEVCHKRGVNLDDGLELMSCERCNKWQHIRCHDQEDFIAGKPRRNWQVVDFLCKACTGKGNSPTQQPQSHAYPPQGHTYTHYNGVAVAPTVQHQRYQNQPGHRNVQPVKSALKSQATSNITPYNNGRMAHAVPQAQYFASRTTQTSPRQQPSAASNINATRPTPTAPNAHAPAPTPYTSTPNMYLSNYTSNYRPQGVHHTAVQQQVQPPSHYRGQIAAPSTHTGVWQEQSHYAQLAPWNGTAQGAVPPHSGMGAPLVNQSPQQNGYYRSRATVPSNPLAQPQQLAPAQQYFTGGPTS